MKKGNTTKKEPGEKTFDVIHPTSFDQANVNIGEGQEEYRPLPALAVKSDMGERVFCWRPSLRQRLKLLLTGRIWHTVYTYNSPLQPQLLTLNCPLEKPAREGAREEGDE